MSRPDAKSFETKEESTNKSGKSFDSSRNKRNSGGRSKGKFNKNKRSRNNSKGDKDYNTRAKTKPYNDLSWYANNPELLAAAARIPFPFKPGRNISLGDTFTREYFVDDPVSVKQHFPGIMRIAFDYTIGTSRDVTSPASIAAKEFFQNIRSAFSSTLPENAPDCFMFCIAVDQIHAYIAYLKRIYRTLQLFTPQNLLTPETLLRAMFPKEVDDVSENAYFNLASDKVRFWGAINTLINMANTYLVPDNMDLYNRHRWMNEHVFNDINSLMGQNYVFTPNGFFKVNEFAETGTQLDYVPLGAYLHTHGISVDSLIGYGIELVRALSEWEDALTINGHIMRAFAGSTFLGSPLLLQEERLEPAYSEEVLLQIHNLKIMAGFQNVSISQNPGMNNAIIYSPDVENLNTSLSILDLPMEAPEAAIVTIASRLSATAVASAAGYDLICGTEVVTGVSLSIPNWMLPGSPDDNRIQFVELNQIELPYTVDRYHRGVRVMKLLTLLSAFRMAPLVLVKVYMASAEPQTEAIEPYAWYHGDINNIAVIENQQLAEIHRVCVYSEFNCFR